MPLPENIIILFYWTAPDAAVFNGRRHGVASARFKLVKGAFLDSCQAERNAVCVRQADSFDTGWRARLRGSHCGNAKDRLSRYIRSARLVGEKPALRQ